MIEYRKLKQDGHCSLCGREIEREDEEVRIVTFYNRSKNPKVNICAKCAYDIFYAPLLINNDNKII